MSAVAQATPDVLGAARSSGAGSPAAAPAAPSAGERAKVVIVGTGLTPYRVFLLRRLMREIPEVEWITLNTMHPSIEPWRMPPPPDLNFEHIDTRPRQRRGLREAWARWRVGGKVIKRLRQIKPDAVIVSGYHYLGHLRVLRWLRGRRIATLFISDSNIHADRARGFTRTLKSRIVPWVVRRCDPILVCGSLGKQYFEKYGAREGQCIYAPYEPDYEQIERIDPALVEQMRAQYRFDPARKRLVFCGRMVEQKRPDLALGAFVEVAHEFPDWDLIMVGDGVQREWLGYITPTDLRRRILFTGFVGKQDQLSAIYRNCHAMILPSDWEPWGVVINEAVAAGLAVVATNVVGAAVELVQPWRNGFLVPPGDRRALAGALRELMAPGRVEQMRAEAPGALADWRRDGDPIKGTREALARIGVLKPGA